MAKLFMMLFGWVFSVGIKKLLLGAGLGLVSGGIMLAVLNYYMSKVQEQAGLLGEMAQILKIGGFDVALSIIFGSMIIRATILASQVSLSKLKK